MPVILLKRVPPGAWTAMAWLYGNALAVRAYFGIPFMPTDPRVPDAGGWTLIVTGTVIAPAGCALLRRRPLPALALLLGGTFTLTLGVDSLTIGYTRYAAPVIALGWIAAGRPRRDGIAALVMAIAVLPAYQLTRIVLGRPLHVPDSLENGDWHGWASLALTAVVAWLIGDSIRQSRAYAERLSVETTARAVTDERLRIAREMHDTVAHSIGIIALQAGAAARVATTQPEAAREAMRAVETTGRETLAGLRRMLVALRAADAGHGDGRDVAQQAAGLDDVDRLAAATTAAGVHVEVRRRGEPRPLPPEIDLSAFRIIQESVTNVVRHSGTHACRVTVDYGDGEVALEVTDDGRGHGTSTDTGFGLAGMKERVALLHGEFSAAPRPEGGFRVAARLPVPVAVR